MSKAKKIINKCPKGCVLALKSIGDLPAFYIKIEDIPKLSKSKTMLNLGKWAEKYLPELETNKK